MKAFLILLIFIIMVLANCVSEGDLRDMDKPIDGVSSSSDVSSSSEEVSSSSEESSSNSEDSSSSGDDVSSSSEESSSSFVEGGSSSSEEGSSSSEDSSSSSEGGSSSSEEGSSSSDDSSSSSEQGSSSSEECEGMNTNTHFCYGGEEYLKCNESSYDPMVKGCCSFTEFSLENQICENATIKTRCGTGNVYHNPATEQCCGNAKFTTVTEFCQEITNVVKLLCGGQSYITAQYCSNGTKKTYGTMVDDGNNTYKTVEIDSQIWMAENLNYALEGSKCALANTGNINLSSLSDNNTPLCDIYGRLYNWAMAMDIDADCNTSSCQDKIETNHKGICPDGWHIPSASDWNTLIRYVHEDNGYNNYTDGTRSIAGKHLKATSSWNENGGVNGNGEDKYGLAVLASGFGRVNGTSGNFGAVSFWWNTGENNTENAGPETNAIRMSMYNVHDEILWAVLDKAAYSSVRCVKNPQ